MDLSSGWGWRWGFILGIEFKSQKLGVYIRRGYIRNFLIDEEIIRKEIDRLIDS